MPPFLCQVKSSIFLNECDVSTESKNMPATALHRVLFAEVLSINSTKSDCTSLHCHSTDSTYCIKGPRILGSVAMRNVQEQTIPFKAIFQWKLSLDRENR